MNGKVIACVMGGYEGHRGWINYLAVHPDHRKIGHGSSIMNKAEEMLRERGCPKINLQVRDSNTAVIKFYESSGFGNDYVVSLGKRLAED
ncbi:GNAT family N-acetyltransferase [Desulfococcaceae bacterium HSG8]|nr:GNAT family N-acetyltransferase [Desulfococcaceae bacterium HSG8]